MPDASPRCDTRYPVVLVHGAGFRDDSRLYDYWGRIPETLRAQGARVYFGGQDAWGTVADNAATIKDTIERVLAETGAAKVNLIAHSKGGLDCRYMISQLGMADKVASLTTMATPHHGSRTMEWLTKLPRVIHWLLALFVNFFFRLLGDTRPRFYEASRGFSQSAAARFNEENPDQSGVYYASYTSIMRGFWSHWLFAWTWLIINAIEGPNDGMCTAASAQWGDFKGVIEGSTRTGVSHGDNVDMRRTDIPGADILGVYVGMAAELKERGL